ncbi:MAG: PspC domain-containing protein [Bifidobacteriaceae bacterium]|jgi:phage shock protein PspC (stress-responsive transcriptional regulator)|nr:PspC domain-containing protein [Bifidobacteriaceae bacterium]
MSSSVPPSAGPGPAPARPPAGQGFFNWIRQQSLWRAQDRWFGGVASGIAHRLGWDPLIVRGIFVVATIFSGAGLLLYGLGWLFLPEAADGRIHAQEALSGRWSAGTVGGILAVIAGSVGAPVWLSATGVFGFGWAVLIVLAALIVIDVSPRGTLAPPGPAPAGVAPAGATPPPYGATPPPYGAAPAAYPPAAYASVPFQGPPPFTGEGASTMTDAPETPSPIPASTPGTIPFQTPGTPPAAAGPAYAAPAAAPFAATKPVMVPVAPARPPAPRRRPGGLIAFIMVGLFLLAMASVMVVERYTGLLDDVFVTAFGVGVALCMVGLGLIVLGVTGRRVGGFVAASVVLVLASGPIVATSQAVHMGGDQLRVGDFYYKPTTVSEVQSDYGTSFGSITLDLSQVDLSAQAEPVYVDLAIGIGHAKLVVPKDAAVELEATAEAGAVEFSGGTDWRLNWHHIGAGGSRLFGGDGIGLTWDGSASSRPGRVSDWAGEFLADAGHGLSVWLQAESPAVTDGQAAQLIINVDCAMGRVDIYQGSQTVTSPSIPTVPGVDEPDEPDEADEPDEPDVATSATPLPSTSEPADSRLEDVPAIPTT